MICMRIYDMHAHISSFGFFRPALEQEGETYVQNLFDGAWRAYAERRHQQSRQTGKRLRVYALRGNDRSVYGDCIRKAEGRN